VDILGMLGFALSVVVGLVILVILVAMHEFGHGVVARRNGVRVEEFGIGFPPRAKAWTVKQSVLGKNVEYSLNWLPLGGFVKLQGGVELVRALGDSRSFTVSVLDLRSGEITPLVSDDQLKSQKHLTLVFERDDFPLYHDAGAAGRIYLFNN
jgi:membrane-associated protease RseP (regulator of RpoE activity)